MTEKIGAQNLLPLLKYIVKRVELRSFFAISLSMERGLRNEENNIFWGFFL